MSNPKNAIAIRFRPLIDVDIDKTTCRVVRVDVDFSESVTTDAYDYDLEGQDGVDADFEIIGDSPEYAAALVFVTDPLMPRIRAAMHAAATDVGAGYNDSVSRNEPGPSTERADLILAVQLYAGLYDSWDFTEEEKAGAMRALELAKAESLRTEAGR